MQAGVFLLVNILVNYDVIDVMGRTLTEHGSLCMQVHVTHEFVEEGAKPSEAKSMKEASMAQPPLIS